MTFDIEGLSEHESEFPGSNGDQQFPSRIINNQNNIGQFRRRHGFLTIENYSRRSSINNESPFHGSTSSSNTITTNLNESIQPIQINSNLSKNHESKTRKIIELGSEANESMKKNSEGIGKLFLKRFLKINTILFPLFLDPSTLLLLLLLFLSLLGEYFVYQVGLISSKYYKTLSEKDFEGFWNHTLISIGLILGTVFIKSTKDFTARFLSVLWRQYFTVEFHRQYFSKHFYYHLNALDKVIDNPDQRLTQDVDKFTRAYGEILPKFLIAPFVIGYYSYQAFTKAGWYGPGACFIFFILATLVNRLAMLPIVRLIQVQEKCEGDFRFIHMLIRMNAEAIAFLDGGRNEKAKADGALNRLVHSQRQLVFRQFILASFTNLFDYLGSILSYLILAIPIFSGVYDSESSTDLTVLISQTSFVNMYLIYQFSQLVDVSNQIAELIGLVHRLNQFLERLGEIRSISDELFPAETYDLSSIHYSNGIHKEIEEQRLNKITLWSLKNVSYSPPKRNSILVSNLTLDVNNKENLLIIGESSAGKSSLLRILRGLWPISTGSMNSFLPVIPELIFYCPQKAYLSTGTLREQICYPLTPTENGKEQDFLKIKNYLQILNLTDILERVGGSLDAPVPWNIYESLSPGEVQRLIFARVFYHRPLVVVLDESTSAIPEEMEAIIYEECRNLGITTVTVGHRRSLEHYHQKILKITGNGEWKLIQNNFPQRDSAQSQSLMNLVEDENSNS